MDEAGVGMDGPRGLSQMERVVNTFVAPTATFKDILRSTSWWLPFVLMAVFSTAATYSIDRQVGFSRVAETQIQVSPKQAEQLAELTPQRAATQMRMRAIGDPLYGLCDAGAFTALLRNLRGDHAGHLQLRIGRANDLRAGLRCGCMRRCRIC